MNYNRSGKYIRKGKGIRSLKLQGTSKLGHCCSAYMKAKEYESGELEVEVCDYHTHEKQLAHYQYLNLQEKWLQLS